MNECSQCPLQRRWADAGHPCAAHGEAARPTGSSPKHHRVFWRAGPSPQLAGASAQGLPCRPPCPSITGGTKPRGRVMGSLQGFGGHSGFTSSICCLWTESRHDTQGHWASARLCRRKSLQRHCSLERHGLAVLREGHSLSPLPRMPQALLEAQLILARALESRRPACQDPGPVSSETWEVADRFGPQSSVLTHPKPSRPG